MHIQSVDIENFGIFKGVHELTLDAIPYAITATKGDDPDRSNYCGKTLFLEAILFCFFGIHRHRLEEGWISKGEKHGGVCLRIVSGDHEAVLERTKTIGTATKFVVRFRESTHSGDAAQREVEHFLGLSSEDFQSTSFFKQKETSGLLAVDPGARTALVARWLKLDPLEVCAKRMRQQTGTAEQDASKIAGRLEGARRRLQLAEEANEVSISVLLTGAGRKYQTKKEMQEDLEVFENDLASWEEALRLTSERESNARLYEEKTRLGAEGKALLKEHKAEDGAAIEEEARRAREDHEAALRAYDESARTCSMRKLAVMGDFDGVCPVAGIACPAKDMINAGAEETQHAYAIAKEQNEADAKTLRSTAALKNEAEAALRARQDRALRLRTLQERFLAIKVPEIAKSDMPLLEVQEHRDSHVREIHVLKHRMKEHDAASSEILLLEKEETKISTSLEVFREAMAIFKQSQRTLAEGALGQIEETANEMLALAGVDLSMRIEWEREGKGIADECAKCGQAFPSSAKVKKCTLCGEARGPKRVQKLEVELSDRSGAAEDLAGLALSLAAGRWLRGERGSRWSVVFLDEVGAHLDRAHRRALSSYMPALLTAAHVQQAFVISHDGSSVASLPGKIEIVREGEWSLVRVA